MERVVSSHSQVQSAGEVQQFPFAVRRMTGVSGLPRHAAAIFAAAANVDTKALGELYLGSTTRLRGTQPRFVDKLPLNFLYVGLIAKALPNARIVHVTRNADRQLFRQLQAAVRGCVLSFLRSTRDGAPLRSLSAADATLGGRAARAIHRRRVRRRLTADLEHEARRVIAASVVAVGRRVRCVSPKQCGRQHRKRHSGA